MTFNSDGSPKPFAEWDRKTKFVNNGSFMFGSGGGTLFRPANLYKDLTNIELALKMAPTADDLWLNAMSRLSNCKIIAIDDNTTNVFLPILLKNDIKLLSENVLQGQNDTQLEKINCYYNATLGVRVFSRR